MALWSFRRPAKPLRAVYFGKSPRSIMVKSCSKSLIHVLVLGAFPPCILEIEKAHQKASASSG